MAGTVILNVFIVVMNISTAGLTLASIMTTLGMSLDEAQWGITGYMTASAVVVPTVGWLGNVLGNRNLLPYSLSLFVAGSVLCGLAWNGAALIAFRILQGLGGGPTLPTLVGLVLAWHVFGRHFCPRKLRGDSVSGSFST